MLNTSVFSTAFSKRRERATATQAEAPKSRPLDKLLGRKADPPAAGKVYDKRSAWAGAEKHPM